MRARALLAATALALGACGKHQGDEPPPKAIHVRAATAQLKDFTVRRRLSGRIAPPFDQQTSVSAQVAGRVQEVTVREGQRVKSGEVLARVDARPLDDLERTADAALKRARAESVFKHDVARRSRELFEKGVASRQEAESDELAATAADAAVVEATSNLTTARRNRGFTEISATFEGVVVRVLKHPGEQVDGTPATPIVEVAGLHPLEVTVDVPSDALARLRVGDPAEVVAGTEKLPARVVRVAGALDAASVVGGVRLRFAGAEPALPLGTPVEVSLVLEELKGAVSVPRRAVRRGPEGGAEVVLVADGKAKAAPVTTGPEEGEAIAIREGLRAGDVVVVEDPLGLADGTALEIDK